MRALGMVDGGRSYSEIARFFDCSHPTICNLVRRNQKIGSVRDRQLPRLETCTTPAQDNHIRLVYLSDRFRTATRTAAETPGRHYPRISSSAVRRMVWAGIFFRHGTPLAFIDNNLTAHRYITDILESHVVPLFEDHPDVTVFQQDNARPHSAYVTRDYLHANGIDFFPALRFHQTWSLSSICGISWVGGSEIGLILL